MKECDLSFSSSNIIQLFPVPLQNTWQILIYSSLVLFFFFLVYLITLIPLIPLYSSLVILFLISFILLLFSLFNFFNSSHSSLFLFSYSIPH